jgi:hypothetical protein
MIDSIKQHINEVDASNFGNKEEFAFRIKYLEVKEF